MKRRWFISLVVTIGAVGALAGATVASADVRDRVSGGPLYDRVASILGIERSELDDAFALAKSELQAEQRAEALAELVANNTLTDAEAVAIGEWLDARPAALDGIKSTTHEMFRFHRGDLDLTKPASLLEIPIFTPERLADLVENEKLTQAQADEVQAWLDLKPESVEKIAPKPLPGLERLFEGVTPFGNGGFFRFDNHGDEFDFNGLQEQLERFREELTEQFPDLEGTIPQLEVPEGGRFQFDGDGFDFNFEFRGGPGFFRHDFDGDGPGFFRGFRGFAPQPAPEPTDSPEPINL